MESLKPVVAMPVLVAGAALLTTNTTRNNLAWAPTRSPIWTYEAVDAQEAARRGDREASAYLAWQQQVEGSGDHDGGGRSECASYEPCGVVHNRSGAYLRLSRDSASHTSCDPRGPYARLPGGSNSDTRLDWQDTDCFTGLSRAVYYAGRRYRPGEWIRIYSHVWVY